MSRVESQYYHNRIYKNITGYTLTAFICVILVAGVFAMLTRTGSAYSAIDSDGYITIPEDAEPVYTYTIGQIKYEVYNTDDGDILYAYKDDSLTGVNTGIGVPPEGYSIVGLKAGEGVTQISANAYQNNTTIQYLDMSECTTVTTIGGGAFDNTPLKSVVISDDNNITSIATYAFRNCSQLESFPFEKLTKITSLGLGAFMSCSSLPEVNLSNSTELTSLGTNCFLDCANLTKADLSACTLIPSIPQAAYKGCSNLSTVLLPDDNNISSIGANTFSGCSQLESFPFDKLTELTSLGENCFFSCSNLAEADLSQCNKLTYLGQFSFESCGSLTKVDLRGCTLIKSIPSYAFRSCSKLSTVLLPNDNNITLIGSAAFQKCSNLESFPFEKLTELTTLGVNCFHSCINLTKADLSGCTLLTSIPDGTFQNCSKLSTVLLPEDNNIVGIGYSAFSDCSQLESFPFEKLTKITSMKDYAFNRCSKLEKVDLSKCTELKTFGKGCFQLCSSLTKADLSGCTILTSISDNMFQQCSKLSTVLLPEDNNITGIEGQAFYCCTALESFPFEKLTKLNSINLGAFCYSGLVEINLKNTQVTVINKQVFSRCVNLKKVALNVNTTRICQNAFDTNVYNGKLTEFNAEELNSLTQIDNAAFRGQTGLHLHFSDENTLTYLGTQVWGLYENNSIDFSNLYKLETIDANCFAPYNKGPANLDLTNCISLKTIGTNAFAGDTNGTYPTIVNVSGSGLPSLETIGTGAFSASRTLASVDFSGCTSLNSVGSFYLSGYNLKSPTALKSVNFSGCTSLASIPNTFVYGATALTTADFSNCDALTTVGSQAFYNCTALSNLLLSDNIETIGEQAFYNCKSLKEITLQAPLTCVGAQAFYGTNALETIHYDAVNLASVEPGTFGNTSQKTKVSVYIDDAVDYIADNFLNSTVNIGTVYFAGPNDSLFIGADAFKAAGLPLSAMSDGTTEYCVDEYGVVYSKDMSTLYYVPPGITSYTVPDSVTTVKSYALKHASDLATLTFADIEGITTLADSAFEDCVTLTTISDGNNSTNLLSEARAMFVNATIGNYAFENTGLIDDIDSQSGLTKSPIVHKTMIDEDTDEYVLSTFFKGTAGEILTDINPATKRIPSVENVNENIFYYLTNDIATVNINLSATAATESKVCRVYFKTSSDNIEFELVEGKNNSISTEDGQTFDCAFNRIAGTNIYYMEFAANPGSTLGFSTTLYYPNLSVNSGYVTLWSEIVNSTDAKLKLTPDSYQKAQWYTAAQKWSVTKGGNITLQALKAVKKDGVVTKRIYSDLSYTITSTSTYGTNGDTSDTAGQDPVEYITYTDTISLPAGIVWEDKVVEAVRNGDYSTALSNTTRTIYVTIDGQKMVFATISNSPSEVELVVNEDNTISVIFKKYNTKLDANTTTSNKWELDNLSFVIVFNADEIFIVGDDYDITKASTIKNNVTQEEKYLYAVQDMTSLHTEDMFLQSASVGTNVPISSNPRTVIWKDIDIAPAYGIYHVYGGAKANFTLSVTNDGVVDHTKTKVTDPLPQIYKITPDDMEEMFHDEVNGEDLQIVISKAYKQKRTITDVTDTQGNTRELEPIDQGVELSDSDLISTITIQWAPDKTYIQMDADGEKHTVGQGQEYSSLMEAFNDIGILNVWSTIYKVNWLFGEEKQVTHPGDKYIYNIKATAKTTFEKITEDKLTDAYGGNGTTYETGYYNTGYVYFNADYSSGRSQRMPHSCSWDREVRLTQSLSVNGVTIDNSNNSLNVDDVLDYTTTITKYGNGVEETVPLNNEITGMQALLVPVDSNEEAYLETTLGNVKLSDLGLATYTDSDNHTYYILSENGTYRNVKLGVDSEGNLLATDRITVEKQDTTLNTHVYWYLPDIATETISYKTILSDMVGNTEAINNGTYANVVYMNERPKDRLFSPLYGSGNVITSDKEIVISGAATEGEQTATYSELVHGDSVTYKLTVRNMGADRSKRVDTVYDKLPNTYGDFEWSKDNVSLYYMTESGKTNATIDKWKISDIAPDGTRETGIYYIYWNKNENAADDSSEMVLAGGETVYIYVTLRFPDNIDGIGNWDAFEEDVMNHGNTLQNIFSVNDENSTVDHSLKVVGEAVLQKGVYGIYRYSNNYGAGYDSRLKYSGSDSAEKYVSYYVTVYNSGDGRLYLNDIQDVLPEGFSYHNLSAVSEIGNATKQTSFDYTGAGYISASCIPAGTSSALLYNYALTYAYEEGVSDSTDIDNLIARVSDINLSGQVQYMAAYVAATPTSDGVVFRISNEYNGDYDSRAYTNIGYDEDIDMCYLEKGQALVFGYTAHIGYDYETEVKAVNIIGMEYYDYNGAGFKLSEDVDIRGQYTKNTESRNEGSQNSIDNVEAAGKKLTGTGQFLESEVTITKGDIIPGATKSIDSRITKTGNELSVLEGGLCEPTDTEVWKFSLYNNGDKPLNSYTITETMQYPYIFEGNISLRIYDPMLSMTMSRGGITYTGTDGNAGTYITLSNDSFINNIKITDGSGNELTSSLANYERDNVKISFNTNIYSSYNKVTGTVAWTTKAYEMGLGEEITCEFNWAGKLGLNGSDRYYINTTKHYFKIKMDLDDENNLVLTITFDENDTDCITAIPAGGYAALSIQTKKPDGITVYSNFINSVMLTPLEDYIPENVTTGTVVKDTEGNALGVKASSMFTVKGAYTTTAYKTVTDDSDSTNTADSRNENNYITLLYDYDNPEHYSTFTYTLNVVNRCDGDAISKMVIIDNLPEVDDHMAYASDASKRYSEYKVLLSEISDSAIAVYDVSALESTSIPRGTDPVQLMYTIEFSTSTSFNNDDWNGNTDEKWMSFDGALDAIANGIVKYEDIRSFRVIVSGGEGIAREDTLTVSVKAKARGDAKRGKISWNNFGYKYLVNAGGMDISLSASSLNVGVMTETVPRIKKIFTSGTGTTVSAVELGIAADFVIYRAGNIEFANEQELYKYLYDNNIPFTIAHLTSEQIDNSSWVELENLKQYEITIDADETYTASATANTWKWQEGEAYTYTFNEINLAEHVLFDSMQGNKQNSYSMTYYRDGKYNIVCENVYDDYNFILNKQAAGTSKLLEGAVFAEYGSITGNPDDSNYQSKLENLWNIYVDSYIDASDYLLGKDSYTIRLGAISKDRLTTQKSLGYEQFVELDGVKKTITTVNDVGDDFCMFYTMDNGDGTVKTYYFKEYKVTDSEGTITYVGTVQDQYSFLEIAAPTGYKLDYHMYTVSRSAATGQSQSITVSDKPEEKLPNTGDLGMYHNVPKGFVLMLLSMIAFVVHTKIRREGGMDTS